MFDYNVVWWLPSLETVITGAATNLQIKFSKKKSKIQILVLYKKKLSYVICMVIFKWIDKISKMSLGR